MIARLKEKYEKECIPELKKSLNQKNVMSLPKLEKVVINIGLGKAVLEPKIVDVAVKELTKITGQKPVVAKAKKAIANFKLREGMPIGCMVTLRGAKMYDFMDRLFNIALPRVRDFKGVSPKAFDGKGNYTLGIRDHSIFPEIEVDILDRTFGLNISFVTSSHDNSHAKSMLAMLGMPFREK